jgi:predicted DsbA family dithiol-disulfide isomerase
MAAEVVDEVLGGPGGLAGAYAEAVRSDEAAAQELGITGVPHFIINGKWAVPGAQDVETMVLVLRRAWERSEVAAS